MKFYKKSIFVLLCLSMLGGTVQAADKVVNLTVPDHVSPNGVSAAKTLENTGTLCADLQKKTVRDGECSWIIVNMNGEAQVTVDPFVEWN
jgi:hypothetical protein